MVQNLVSRTTCRRICEIAMNMGMDGAWGQWVNRWTAGESARHRCATTWW